MIIELWLTLMRNDCDEINARPRIIESAQSNAVATLVMVSSGIHLNIAGTGQGQALPLQLFLEINPFPYRINSLRL